MKKQLLIFAGIGLILVLLGLTTYGIIASRAKKESVGKRDVIEQQLMQKVQEEAKKVQQPSQEKALQGKQQSNLLGIHAILDHNLILGGIVDGKWVDNKEMAKLLKGGEKYKICSDSKILGEYTVDKPKEENYISGDKGYKVSFGGDYYIEGMKFGIMGNWNPMPRQVIVETTGLDKYKDAIKEELYRTGLSDDNAVVKKVWKVDLDGDGGQEALIYASNITQDDVDKNEGYNLEYSQGKYSMLLLQRNISGKKVNTIISERIDSLFDYDVPIIADLDGDGQMEFVVSSIYIQAVQIEGWASCNDDLYKMNDVNVERKLHIFYHPI